MIRVRLRVTAFTALALVFSILFPVGLLAGTPPSAAHLIEPLDPFARDHVPGSLLVALNNTTAPTVHLSDTDTLVHLQVASSYEERTSPSEERETYARLLADPRVASVEPNYRVHAMQVPNDPIYSREYWTRSVNLEPAWDITTGSPNVTVAVLDSGVYVDHPDLHGRIAPGFNSIDGTSNVNDDSDIQHGTKVSLLIAARGNDGIGQAGVAWNVKIMPVKVIGKDGIGDDATLTNGIVWATNHGATIINLSVGGAFFSDIMARTIGYARSKNVTVVAAAPDDINNPNDRGYPAGDANVITVGATDENNNPAAFTSAVIRGDVAAPGVNIPFILPEVSGDVVTAIGTSFSTPIVAGIIALMQSIKPDLRQEEALAILKSTVRPFGNGTTDSRAGAGIVDAARAVRAVGGTPPQSGPPPYAATYNRYDAPVLSGAAKRGFIWGPQVNSNRFEAYTDAPGGQRQVWYFDKGRLELNDPQTGQITSGLLVNELVSGQIQIGDAARETRAPAAVAVAGDPGVPGVITYATMNSVRAAAPRAVGSPITEQLRPDGTLTTATSGDATGVTTAAFIKETNHTVASVFWQYLNSTGVTIQNGQTVNGPLFDPTFFVVGLPITEAYWMTATVGGVTKTVLVQAFERRVLTYTPSNPDSFKVEMGNVGQHYVAWRYGG